MKNIYIATELVPRMYNAHPYFSLINLGKKGILYPEKYGKCFKSIFSKEVRK